MAQEIIRLFRSYEIDEPHGRVILTTMGFSEGDIDRFYASPGLHRIVVRAEIHEPDGSRDDEA